MEERNFSKMEGVKDCVKGGQERGKSETGRKKAEVKRTRGTS